MAWIIPPPGAPQAPALLDLVCLAPAGSGASYFWGWEAKLPPGTRLLPVELPGRNSRFKEPLRTHLPSLAGEVAQAVLSFRETGREKSPPPPLRPSAPPPPPPLLVFGHSLGAWLGFEVVRELERRGVETVKLYASGARAPSLAVGGEQDPLGNIATLPPSSFWPRFERRYGVNPALQSPALRAFIQPLLAADLTLTEGYEGATQRLRCAIAAVGVEGDKRHTPAQLSAWREHAGGAFEEKWFAAPQQPAWATPHRWLADDPSALLSWLGQDLEKMCKA